MKVKPINAYEQTIYYTINAVNLLHVPVCVSASPYSLYRLACQHNNTALLGWWYNIQ